MVYHYQFAQIYAHICVFIELNKYINVCNEYLRWDVCTSSHSLKQSCGLLLKPSAKQQAVLAMRGKKMQLNMSCLAQSEWGWIWMGTRVTRWNVLKTSVSESWDDTITCSFAMCRRQFLPYCVSNPFLKYARIIFIPLMTFKLIILRVTGTSIGENKTQKMSTIEKMYPKSGHLTTCQWLETHRFRVSHISQGSKRCEATSETT